MHNAAVLFLILMMGFGLSAQTITLSGKVTNQSGKAVNGAIVTLKSKQLADTTDAEGAFSIKGGTSAVNLSTPDKYGIKAISINNGSITINLSKPQAIQFELFDMQGNLIERVLEKPLAAGNFRFNVMKRSFAASMMLVRASIGERTYSFRYLPLVNGKQSVVSSAASSSGILLAKMDAAADSIQVNASGYKTRVEQISSYEETVNITLETESTEQCTASKSANVNVSGSGPHKVVVETNSDDGINEGTIYRPKDLGGNEKYPIFVWGEGACSKDGSANSAAMAEIASYGYFVIADGTPSGGGSRNMDLATMTKPGRAYVTWIIAENRKPCSAYYQSIDTSKVAGNGFSCGGFLGQGLAGDPRTTTWGVSSSGSFGDAPDLWKLVHTPVLILEGSKDISSAGGTGAYTNGLRDYNGIKDLGKPVYFISNKTMGHGGDLGNANGGQFTKINLAWLNWWLKGDTGATGRGVLVGTTCKYCTDNNWEVKSANLPE